MDNLYTKPIETISSPAEKLSSIARKTPYLKAVIYPEGKDHRNRVTYTHLTFVFIGKIG